MEYLADAISARGPSAAAQIAFVAGLALAILAIVTLVCRRGRRQKPATAIGQRRKLVSDAAAPRLRRQVFLSHTGQDESAKHFTASVLKPALELAGLEVVIDYEYLKPGEDWSQQLVDAAANSAVFVAVLSRTYAERFWCMVELDLALNAHDLRAARQQAAGNNSPDTATNSPDTMTPWVIPVFLDDCEVVVQQDRIRQLWSDAPHAWRASEEAHEVGSLQPRRKWVDAECWATNMAATVQRQNLRLTSLPGKDALHQLAERVVEAALKQLPVGVDEGPVVAGLEKPVAQLVVRLSGGRRGVWLHGPGGCGKTTLGKRLFNQLLASSQFQCSAIVEVQHDDGSDKTKLAGHLRGVLRKLTGKDPVGGSAAELAAELKAAVASHRVLYMLDNVWTPEQLAHLLPTEWGAGSIVIITSRYTNMNSPALLKVKESLVFSEVASLGSDASRELLRTCAGLPEGPPAALRKLEELLLQRCAGLPLALTIVGGSLQDSMDIAEWKGVVAALACGTPAADTDQRLRGLLKHSLDVLPPQAVSMFLDVATVMRRWDLADALVFWEGWHGAGARVWFKDLQRCSLVAEDEVGFVKLHDVVALLGRSMVLDSSSPHHGTRLWVEAGRVVGVPGEVLAPRCKVLLAELDIFLGSQGGPSWDVQAPQLDVAAASMDWSEVKLLRAGRAVVPMSSSAVWVDVIEWQQLVGLSPSGRSALDDARQLRVLRAGDCRNLVILPGCLEHMTGLISINMYDCHSLVGGLEHLPASLRHLRLSEGYKLNGVPDSMCRLTSLTRLDLSYSTMLASLPDSLGRLTALECLSLQNCSQLATLPGTVGNLTLLTELDLLGCPQLAALPQSLGQLVSLQKLQLDACSSITELPDALGKLSELQVLTLSYCVQLAALPDSLGQLTSLTLLDLCGCSGLPALPQSLGQLVSLQRLSLNACSSITELPAALDKLSQLEVLTVHGCRRLASLPDSLGQLTLLTLLDLCGCSVLPSPPQSLGQLVSLQELWLNDCSSITELPATLGNLSQLPSAGTAWLLAAGSVARQPGPAHLAGSA